MRALNNNLRLTMAAVAAALSFGLGCWYSHWMLWTTGAVCLGYLAAQWTRYRRGMALADDSTANAAEAWAHPPEVLHRKPIDPSDTVSLVEGMLAQSGMHCCCGRRSRRSSTRTSSSGRWRRWRMGWRWCPTGRW